MRPEGYEVRPHLEYVKIIATHWTPIDDKQSPYLPVVPPKES